VASSALSACVGPPTTNVRARSSEMKRLLIVVGCPRSGTTWLQQLLLSHPQVVGPSEETFLFARLAPAWALAHSAEGDIWGDRATSIAAIRRFCDRILPHVP